MRLSPRLLLFVCLTFSSAACQKKSQVQANLSPSSSTHAVAAAPSPTVTPTPPPEDKESLESQLRQELDQKDKLLAEKERQIEEAKAGQASSENALSLIASTEGPRAEMVARLKQGADVPVLIYVYGVSEESLRSIESEIATANQGKAFYRGVVKNSNGRKVLGEFLINLNSLETFKNLWKYAKKLEPETKVAFFPVKSTFARGYVQLTYKKQDIINSKASTKIFWIGDSEPASMVNLPRSYNDLEAQWDYLKSCEHFGVPCLKTLLDHGYFKNTTWVDSSARQPLDFFRKEIVKFLQIAQKGNIEGLKNYFDPTIQDIKFFTNLWVVYPDTTELQELALFHGPYGFEVAEKRDEGALYQSPMWYAASLPSDTTDPQLNLLVGARRFYDFICSVSPCLQRNP